jgi:hypothetical protein
VKDQADELTVEVCLPRDHVGPVGGLGDIVPKGTWVPGWMRRSDWRDGAHGRTKLMVRYSVTHRGTAYDYLAEFDENHIRLIQARPSASRP